MSIPAWVLQALQVDYSRFLPLWVQERRCGWVTPEFAQTLARWPRVFECEAARVGLSPWLATPPVRTEAMAAVLEELRAEGVVTGWRDERYEVYAEASGEPLFAMERAAVKRFGVRSRATHVNGLVETDDGPAMWIARRSDTKATDPGKLDNLVGGGIAAGYDGWGTLLKECWEEAGIPPTIAHKARPRDTLRFDYVVSDGLDSNEVESFDLLLPFDFRPVNQDGEVAEFRLVALSEVRELLARPQLFTVDAALVAWSCLRRWEQSDV